MRYSKKPKYNTGGQIGSALGSTATTFIPGVGPLLAPLGGMIGGMIGKSLYKEKQPEIPKNIAYGNMGYKYGGKVQSLGKGAKKFVGPKHEDGGILIDEQGNPVNQQEAIAEVEGGETMQNDYIFSDELLVPDTDMTFADAHEMLIAEGADEQEIQQLMQMQEQVRAESGVADNVETPMMVEEQPMEMMQDGGKVRVQSGERMLTNETPTMSSKDYHSGTRQINFNVNGAPADTSYMYKRGLGNEAESFYYNTANKAIDYQNTLKPNASFNTMSPDSISMFRNRINSLANIRNFEKGGNLPKYEDGGGTDPNSKAIRTMRKNLMKQGRKKSISERLERFLGLTKQFEHPPITHTPRIMNYDYTQSFGFVPEKNVDNNVENQITAPVTQNIENNTTTTNSNNFGTRLLQSLALNKMRLDVDRVKPVSYTRPKSSFKDGGYLNKFNNGGDYMRGIITPKYNLEVPKLNYSPSVNNMMYNPASTKLIATGDSESPVIYESRQQLPEITVTAPIINTPVQQSPTSSVTNNWLMNQKADSKYGLNANPMRMNKNPFSLGSTQINNNDSTQINSAGPNWGNIATGLQSATRLGAALFAPRPKASPRATYNPLSTTSPSFANARRQAGSGFRTAMGTNPQAAYAQYLDATSNIASQEADFRSQREGVNEQMRQATERTNMEQTMRDNDARSQDLAARIGLVTQAVDIPVTKMARDEAMKKQLMGDLMISADRISDPIERRRAVERRAKLLGIPPSMIDELDIDNLKYGGMIKRADGSYSKRGLWDNIRANKGSGKKPTKQMLKQEAKIKAKG